MKQKQLSMRWRRQDHKQQRQPNHYRKRHYRKTKWVHTKPRLYGGVLAIWERLLSSESNGMDSSSLTRHRCAKLEVLLTSE